MSAPNYDWLQDLTVVQQKFLEDNYRDLYEEYKTYGYTVMMYDYGRLIDKVYDEVKSVVFTEKIDLPRDLEAAVRKFYETQLEAGNLKEIVIAVGNYHIDVFTTDPRVISELRANIKDIPLIPHDKFDVALLKQKNNLVILDDKDSTFATVDIALAEQFACPILRRSAIGWNEPVIDNTVVNIIENAVKRYKPCKTIRD